jgi:Alpha-kinase family/von Willebrand factor type A domain
MQTSLVSIISCSHGRLRREQRDISKRDLQAAILHGTKSLVWDKRWKFEYDGIIFITDEAMNREITSYPAPLIMAEIDAPTYLKHQQAKQVVDLKPEICTSHTVLVVDNSGSMKTHDIPLHRDRQVMAYSTTALEYIAEQLFNETANNRDVVSLVEFDSTARIAFEREPVSWVLYNKLLKRRDLGGRYDAREHKRCIDSVVGDSNYLPALAMAHDLLKKDSHAECALSMMFLSDGAPDAGTLSLVPAAAIEKICKATATIASEFGDQLNLRMIGFGSSEHDFATLKAMVQAAQDAPGDAFAEFQYCGKVANAVETAVSSLARSTMQTRAALHGRSRTFREVASEDEGSSAAFNFYPILSHFVFSPSKKDFVRHPGLPFGALRDESLQQIQRLSRTPPPMLAVNKFHCGKGAERLAFRCHLSEAKDTSGFRLGAMIAKETREVERIEEHIGFHRSFCETQNLAAHLAGHFNHRLRSLSGFDRTTTPVITFLACSILVLKDNEYPQEERGVLVEKKLDTDTFPWSKWNNNFGGVHGRTSHAPFDEAYELKILQQNPFDEVIEEEEEDSERDSNDEESVERHAGNFNSSDEEPDDQDPSAYLQAFSHFTYLFTNRKVLVCDLQGVLNTDSVPPKFELSDPAIHYRSWKGRRAVFGNTDKGQEGISSFFRTHKCTKICEHMKLSRKNKEWMKDWRDLDKEERN